mmetsp:Transcript_21624/g.47498  ORF Transcript_21624/g.47498 Transcript_21624/m.47498 type:complete len:222 (+) Transcript_21624:663-1328(+)
MPALPLRLYCPPHILHHHVQHRKRPAGKLGEDELAVVVNLERAGAQQVLSNRVAEEPEAHACRHLVVFHGVVKFGRGDAKRAENLVTPEGDADPTEHAGLHNLRHLKVETRGGIVRANDGNRRVLCFQRILHLLVATAIGSAGAERDVDLTTLTKLGGSLIRGECRFVTGALEEIHSCGKRKDRHHTGNNVAGSHLGVREGHRQVPRMEPSVGFATLRLGA